MTSIKHIDINANLIENIFQYCKYGSLTKLIRIFDNLNSKERNKIFNALNSSGSTCLKVAAQHNNINILKYCFDNFSNEMHFQIDKCWHRQGDCIDILNDLFRFSISSRNWSVIDFILKTIHKTAHTRCNSYYDIIR